MSISITANELKTRGIKYVEELAARQGETPITVHGREKYVILPMEEYRRLRDLELEQAVAEARAEYRRGTGASKSIGVHIQRVGASESGRDE